MATIGGGIMTKKYIIKNCQCIYIDYKGTYECDYKVEFCENVTDCLLKQIVEKCKNSTYTIRTPITQKKITKIKKTAQDILAMLEIQECE